MKIENLLNDGLDHSRSDIFMQNISVDCIILSFYESSMKILLYKFRDSNTWILPNNFIAKTEHPNGAALRVLKKLTSLENAYLKQFYFFGREVWINYNNNERAFSHSQNESSTEQCKYSRSVSLGYYALIKYEQAQLFMDEDLEVAWFDIGEMPPLYPEHKEVLHTAREIIRRQVGFLPIGYELLPSKFTMPELRRVYESILGRDIDRRNFQRKMLSIGYIEALQEVRGIRSSHKTPNLYSFIKDKYEEAEKYGIQIMSNNF